MSGYFIGHRSKKSNAIQYNSSVVNFPFLKIKMVSFDWHVHGINDSVFMIEVAQQLQYSSGGVVLDWITMKCVSNILLSSCL